MALSRYILLDEGERAWVLDMHKRNSPRIRKAAIVFSVLLTACLPWFNLLSLIPMGLAFGAILLGDYLTFKTGKIGPFFTAWCLLVVFIAAAIVVNDNQHSGDITLLIFPILGACAGFPKRLIVLSTAYTALVMVAAEMLFGGQAVIDDPPLLIIPIALLVAAVIVTTGLRESSIEHREAAVVDRLTGMLNRTALATRTAELEHQARLTGEQVGVIVADLDHFKAVNDTHGHAAGDQVLQETAYRIRKELRAFDLAYRIGGEEFVLLMPGANTEQAHELAERLRLAIRDVPMAGGVPVTVSIGVAASSPEQPFAFNEIFAAADAALYDAKRAGRDQVQLAGLAAPPIAA
ncbi:MAG: GGDEF domain-containing protein [Solirubrobacteraceae bacterium]|nr:GGDEF domain-containing protein [Solirubrobacteraceae bacterium]